MAQESRVPRVARRDPKGAAAGSNEDLDAVVAATLTLEGELLDANAGFLRLLDWGSAEGVRPLAGFFVRPRFEELRACASTPDGFRGLLHVGPPDAVGWSLRCTFRRVGNELHLLGEHDVRALEGLTVKLLSVNEELGELQRDLQRTTRRLQASEELFRHLSGTDVLTGLANRRQFETLLAAEVERARRYGQPFALVMTDLDHFKCVNDVHGHGVGDCVLRAFAAMLTTELRDCDCAARVGGEEFVLMLPGSDLLTAQTCAERLRVATSALDIPEYPEVLTASFGLTAYAKDDTAETLLKRVDDALYAAKRAGRDRVVGLP